MCDSRAIHGYKKGYRIIGYELVYTPTGKARKLQPGTSGYPQCCIRNLFGKPVQLVAHKLAAYQKYGMRAFRGGIVIRHKDDNKWNFSLDNILIGSQSKNMKEWWRRKKTCSV